MGFAYGAEHGYDNLEMIFLCKTCVRKTQYSVQSFRTKLSSLLSSVFCVLLVEYAEYLFYFFSIIDTTILFHFWIVLKLQCNSVGTICARFIIEKFTLASQWSL